MPSTSRRPVAVTNIAGNAQEGSQIIVNNDQIDTHHSTAADRVNIDIADAKYDITKNYDYIRAMGSIPIIDYNRRRENLSHQALFDRGYDHNGPAPLENHSPSSFSTYSCSCFKLWRTPKRSYIF